MNALSFKLSGNFAFFKKPDVNEYAYFTYNNIPKPALLGLLGAIIGLKGYTQEYQNGNKNNPEFYEKLKHLEISLIPLAKFGRFNKKIQTFNNGVGYASMESGGNLIVREQWLENPSWQVLIKDDESYEFVKISEFLKNKKATFIPYLGKNDHFANISEVEILNLDEFKEKESKIISLALEKNIKSSRKKRGEDNFIFREYYPVGFDENGFYRLEKTVFTNKICELNGEFFNYKDWAVCFM